MPGNCPRCYSWDDDLDFRDGICECCYLEEVGYRFGTPYTTISEGGH